MKTDSRSTIPWPLVRRVQIRNYKSIGQCDVEFKPLTVLVGRNGAGKSNFLDALRFVADGVGASLDHAIQSRGGIDDVRRRSTGHPRNFSISLELSLPQFDTAHYGFEVAARKDGGFAVKDERLTIIDKARKVRASFHRQEGRLSKSSVTPAPPVSEDRLYLLNAAGLPEFRPAFDALAAMGFYNLHPQVIRELQSPDAGELLRRDGRNLASVLSRVSPAVAERVREYLGQIVPGIVGVERVSLGPKETLLFRQEVEGSKDPWKFYATSMSDGTLRALGALTAVMQLAESEGRVRFVGIEEPETALHPAATGALMDALREAVDVTQVAITTHSPEMLDQVITESEGLLVVVAEGGNTKIAPVDAVGAQAIREHLFSAGELFRMDQLRPDPDDLERQTKQLQFGFVEAESPA